MTESFRKDAESMVLEEGDLEETLQNEDDVSSQDNLQFISPRKYYRLQAEETTDERSESRNVMSENLDPENQLISDRFVPVRQGERTKRQTELLFSPEGNEGFMLTTIPSDPSSNNSPRAINEDLFMRRYSYTQSGEMVPQRRDLQDKIMGDLSGLRTSINSIKLTPRKILPDAPFEESFHSGAESTASPRSGGYLTDRATSPSAASVTSLQSVSSQVSVSGRRFLEWDYGSDLGYVDGQLTQVEAAQSLSTLEKLAIGNYSEFLRDSSEDGDDDRRKYRRQLPPDTFDEENNVRMRKFAESLMRQRQLREREMKHQTRRASTHEADKMESPKETSLKSPVRDLTRGRAFGWEDGATTVEPQSLPANTVLTTERLASASLFSPERTRHKKSLKMKRSTSLTEVSGLSYDKDRDKRSLSNCQLSPDQAKYSSHISGPSSSSSGGTVVPTCKKGARNSSRTSEQDSLPSHLEDILIETAAEAEIGTNVEGEAGPRNLTLSSQVSKLSQQSRQSSKRSISNSFETVIAAERCTSSEKDSMDTEDEVLNINVDERVERGGEQAARLGRTADSRSRRINHILTGPRLSANSSVPSTSDEDNERRRRRQELRDHVEDTSTLESVQMIDRAKSFEYIPGESFPLQENSSSYEYLPGHLVPEQRPPTVLNLAPEDLAAEAIPSPNNSSLSTKQDEIKNQELEALTRELRGKSRELLAANLSQTKQFFKKLKRYIDFLSTPSDTVAECRVKQRLAMKITKLLSSEESRLELSGLSRPDSSVSGKSRQEDLQSSTFHPTASRPQPQPRHRSETDQSSSLDSLGVKLQNWKLAKTKSEEKYEKREKSVQKSMRSVDELNRKRIEHLVNLKREIKILERIERSYAKIDSRYTATDSKTESNSSSVVSQTAKPADSPTRKLTYVKTSGATNNSTATGNSSLPQDAAEAQETVAVVDAGTQVEPIETDMSSALSLLSESSRRSVTKYRAEGKVLSRTETIQVRATFESHTEESLMDAPSPRPCESSTTTPTIESSTCVSSSVTSRYSQEERSYWNKENRRKRREKVPHHRKPSRRSKPVAYYLPIDNLSPIRIGKKILKDSYANEQGLHSEKHRNILSQYMASMSTEPVRPKVTIPSRTRDDKKKALSLQEALLVHNPGFVRQSEERIAILREMRRIREQRTEKRNAWLEEIRCLSPRSRLTVRPASSPGPRIHLFTHKEMVSATRNKYSGLPEVTLKKEATKKEDRNETNRLRAQIFSRQLKRKVDRGKVSLNHHDRIF